MMDKYAKVKEVLSLQFGNGSKSAYMLINKHQKWRIIDKSLRDYVCLYREGIEIRVPLKEFNEKWVIYCGRA